MACLHEEVPLKVFWSPIQVLYVSTFPADKVEGLMLWCRYDRKCLIGFKKLQRNSFVSSFLFATETQQTIGEPFYCIHCS